MNGVPFQQGISLIERPWVVLLAYLPDPTFPRSELSIIRLIARDIAQRHLEICVIIIVPDLPAFNRIPDEEVNMPPYEPQEYQSVLNKTTCILQWRCGADLLWPGRYSSEHEHPEQCGGGEPHHLTTRHLLENSLLVVSFATNHLFLPPPSLSKYESHHGRYPAYPVILLAVHEVNEGVRGFVRKYNKWRRDGQVLLVKFQRWSVVHLVHSQLNRSPPAEMTEEKTPGRRRNSRPPEDDRWGEESCRSALCELMDRLASLVAPSPQRGEVTRMGFQTVCSSSPPATPTSADSVCDSGHGHYADPPPSRGEDGTSVGETDDRRPTSDALPPAPLTVILTQFRRNTTALQLRAILASPLARHLISRVFIYQDLKYVDLRYLPATSQGVPIHIVQSTSRNFKYHGRFALASLIATDFTVIIDDDTVPGPGYLEDAVEKCRAYRAVVGPQGLLIARDRQYIAAPPTDYDFEVTAAATAASGLSGPQLVIPLRVGTLPLEGECVQRSWECCEDISISAAAWIHAGVRSLVPAQPHDLVNVWGDTDARFHHDGNQTYSNSVPLAIRWPLTRDWVVRGFIPVGLRDTHFGRSAVCRRPFDGLCQIVVRHIFDQVLSARDDPVPFWRYIDRPDLYQLGVRLSTLTSLQKMCEPLVPFVPQFFDRPMVELLDGHL
eukprot:gene2238-2676_t